VYVRAARDVKADSDSGGGDDDDDDDDDDDKMAWSA
jgi:hypothetical protein